MTKNSSFFFKTLLFVTGIFIIALAYNLIQGGHEPYAGDAFMWASIVVMYLVLFCPFLFSAITVKNFSGKIPSLTAVWTGIFLYIPLSIVVIFLLKNFILSINAALIVQAVLLFLYALNIYFGYFASSHAVQVAEDEAEKKMYLTEIKSKAASLALKAGALPPEYEQIRKELKQTAEDIRYISPVDGGKGMELELQIVSSLDLLIQYCGAASQGSRHIYFEEETKKLRTIVKERKILRN
ncbi:MAG: hypothetical protein LBP76_04630 [Treponema sp.]|jgi:hypothetical protein|nr:hypothetical protein [Treponema sp.]